MKFNKIMIILVISLTILMIGSVSASENITDDDYTLNELESVENSDVLANDTEISNEIANDINITFDQQMWEKNLSNISVQFPENANGTFCLKIGDLEVYNQTVTNGTLSIPVQLPKPLFPYIIENIYPPRDCTNYKVTAFYNDVDLNVNRTLSIMKFPPEYEYWWGISSEILQYDTEFWNTIIFPRSANGIVEVYVDDKLINKTTVNGPFLYYDSHKITDLALGNHTMRLVYYNDTYYYNANRTLTFEVVNVKIDVPTNIYIGHDDCMTVDVLANTSGKVNIYIDNMLVYSGKTDKQGEFLLSLEKYLKYNSSEIKVEFIGKDYSREKTVPINITYDFGYEDGGAHFIYGEENVIEMILPDTLNNSILSVTINGTKFNFTHPRQYMNNIVEVDISKLAAGNYTIVIHYPGDEKFASRTESYNFTVTYSAQFPYYPIFNDNSAIYLNLPRNANGNLTVYIDGKFHKSAKLNKGKASIIISDLMPGEYNVTAIYTGNDYLVNSSNSIISINPKIRLDYFFTAGQDKSATVTVPKDCRGYVIFYIDAKEYNVTIKNGKAEFSFKKLKAGKHIVYIEYYGANGFEMDDDNLITIYKPKLKIVSARIRTTDVNVKVKVVDNKGKAIKKAVVTLKIKGKKFKAKTNKKGIAKIKGKIKLKAKAYKVKAYYNGGKVSKRIAVEPPKHSI